MRPLLLALLASLVVTAALPATEPFLKKGDVIALVGGEDMVVAGELGYLELLLTRALPDYRLRFRSLAWEGDTVFEQRRDLNFPPLEAQLDQVGATVVICQFGQTEMLEASDVPQALKWRKAYRDLLQRMAAGKRRVVAVMPYGVEQNAAIDRAKFVDRALAFRQATVAAAHDAGAKLIVRELGDEAPGPYHIRTRDGVHFNEAGQMTLAYEIARQLGTPQISDLATELSLGVEGFPQTAGRHPKPEVDHAKWNQLLALIRAKNRLWFNYWRVQNWAFLAGDRTEQPSSRDWRDPTKRWFPAEREAFLPLIEAKEREIDALAQKLATP